jgi:amino acid adenylation domain-containing protein
MSDSPTMSEWAGRPRPEVIPLSFEQRRVWFASELGEGEAYHAPFGWRLHGPVRQPILALTIGDVLERHESLRTVFPSVDGIPRQVVMPTRPIFSVAEVSAVDLLDAVGEFVSCEFDLAEDLPLRVRLFVIDATESLLVFVFSHIAVDGWSLAPLTRDLSQAYEARCLGMAPGWPALPVQYQDYALWQHEALGDESDPSSVMSRQLAFWKGALAGLPEGIPLPTNRPRSAAVSGRGGAVALLVSAETHQQAARLARECRSSVFMVMLAAWATVLTRLGAGTDLPIGTPMAGRPDAVLDQLVGFFVNPLLLRVDTSCNPSFRELLGRVRALCLDAFDYQDVPFDRVVEAMNPRRVLGRHPLFQVLLTLNEGGSGRLGLTGINDEPEPVQLEASKYDLALRLAERRDAGILAGIEGTLQYPSDLFDKSTAEMIAGCWTRVLAQVTAHPDQLVGDVDVIGEELRQRLLSLGRGESRAAPGYVLPEMFESQVKQSPDRIAVVEGRREVTYSDLNERANRLAHWLIARRIGPGDLVAIKLPRSVECIVAIWGILKAGSAYVPIDPDYPAARIKFLLDDARPTLVITGDHELRGLLGSNPQDCDRIAQLLPEHAAYVLYTSGSAGQPKGVVVEHRQVVNYLAWASREYRGVRGTALLHSSISFDLTVSALLTPLMTGGCVNLADLLADAPDPQAALKRFPATFLKATPSHLPLLAALDYRYSPSDELLLGGEALFAEALAPWREGHPQVTVFNVYGPTEATVNCAQFRIETGRVLMPGPVPIGTPHPNTRLYVLDEGLALVAPGVPGELYIGGRSLARGYLNRPGLTAERFLPDPFGPAGSRMYRTGDRVRWRADDTLEFLGRFDDQVKLRGHRIELGEITSALLRHAEVSQVVVVLREDQPGDQRLAAYLTGTKALDEEEVREHAAKILPDYMMPAAIVILDELPLTRHGKVDRAALPAPRHRLISEGRQLRTEHEHLLAGLFADVLNLPSVGAQDNFFELGGHSLLATRLVTRIRAALSTDITLRTIFEAPTVAALASILDGHENALGLLLPIVRSRDAQATLLCVHPAGGLAGCYAALEPYVPAGISVYGLQARGLTGSPELPVAIEEIVSDYVATIRTMQRTGPYRLLGWSFGGIIAHAVATRLQQIGERVDFLVLLDAFPRIQLSSASQSLIDDPTVQRAAGDPTALIDQAVTFDTETRAAVARVLANNGRLSGQFNPGVYHGDMLFIRAVGETNGADAPDCWRPFVTGDLIVHEVDFGHAQIMSVESVSAFGPVLAEQLRRLTDNRG